MTAHSLKKLHCIDDADNEQSSNSTAVHMYPETYELFLKCCDRKRHTQKRTATNVLLFIDADNLKLVNDSFGHSTGDRFIDVILRTLSDILPYGSVICRIGGDEFLAFCAFDTQCAAKFLSKKLAGTLNQVQDINSQKISMSCSIGAAQTNNMDASLSDLFEKADTALLWAKRNGKGRLKFFSEQECKLIKLERSLILDLPIALQRGEVEVFYQPIFSTNAREVRGAEALVRWFHPIHGKIPTNLIISVASKTGKIRDLGEYVLERACLAAKEWPEHLFVSVNFAASDFQQVDFAERIVATISNAGLLPKRVHMEITELEYLLMNDDVRRNMKALGYRGIQIGVDDFGIGFSSMGSIDKFPADFIKIDISLINNCNARLSSKIFLRAIRAIAQGAGLKLIAEGVETLEELAVIRSVGIELAQGFYYSTALKDEDFIFSLNKQRAAHLMQATSMAANTDKFENIGAKSDG